MSPLSTDFSLISRLYSGSREDFLESLLSNYQANGFSIVNYLYFASATKYRLFESPLSERDVEYKRSLTDGDFLLPDGIALQVFAYVTRFLARSKDRHWIENLNGTDLTPFLLNELPNRGTVSVYLYNLYDPKIGKTEEWIEKSLQAFRAKFPRIHLVWNHTELYANRGKTLDFHSLETARMFDLRDFALFLNCTGSPFQEIWIEKHREFFEKNRFIVLNSGWVIDFISGFEKRAPGLLVKLRVFETFWRILSNPKKNLPKFLSMFGIFRILAKSLLRPFQ